MHLAQLDDLEQITTESSSEKRREQLRGVTDLFFASNASANDEALGVFDGVMGILARNLEMAARRELARRLAAADKAPPELIYKLANDDIDVARPVLETYRGFSDGELTRIAGSQRQDHLHAISGRSDLSEKVTDVLVQRGDEGVLGRVMDNQSARFSQKGFETLSIRCEGNAGLQGQLSARPDIPKEVLEEVSARIACRLKSELADHSVDVSNNDIFNALSTANEHVQNCAFNREASENAHRYIRDLEQDGRLTEIELSDLARNGRTLEVVHALASMANIDSDMAYHVLLKADPPALAVSCRASELSADTFTDLLNLKIREQKLPDGIQPMLTQRYRTLPMATAQRVMRFLNVRLKTE